MSHGRISPSAVGAAVRADDREAMRARVEQAFAPGDRSFACLSARTAFDALLTALDLPAASELVVSVLTIAGVPRVVVVPVDVDMEPLSLDVATLEV
jgi:perosamine synthetase